MRSSYHIRSQTEGNRTARKCHEATGFLSRAGAKAFAGCKEVEGSCSAAAQPRTALPAAQQLGGCSAKNGLFPLQLWCFPPPLFSRLCTGAMLRRGSERQCEEPQAGQAAAPHLKHHSASETPCPCKGDWDSGAGEMEKGLLACAGERTDKGNLCLSWAALPSSSREDTLSLLPTVAWCCGPCTGSRADKWRKALLLPYLCQPALAL